MAVPLVRLVGPTVWPRGKKDRQRMNCLFSTCRSAASLRRPASSLQAGIFSPHNLGQYGSEAWGEVGRARAGITPESMLSDPQASRLRSHRKYWCGSPQNELHIERYCITPLFTVVVVGIMMWAAFEPNLASVGTVSQSIVFLCDQASGLAAIICIARCRFGDPGWVCVLVHQCSMHACPHVSRADSMDACSPQVGEPRHRLWRGC